MTDLHFSQLTKKIEQPFPPKGAFCVNDAVAETYDEYEKRKCMLIVKACEAALLVDPYAWRRQESMGEVWDGPGPAPTIGELRWAGAPKSVYEHLESGDPALDDLARPWTGSFWSGLEDSGAMRRLSARRGKVTFGRLPELSQDIDEARIFIKRTSGRWEKGLEIHSPSLLLRGAEEPNEEWFAGLLCGMTLKCRRKKWGLETLGATDRAKEWLTACGVNWGEHGGGMVISPFYMPLVMGLCPSYSGLRWGSLENRQVNYIWGCPELPLAMWEVVFGKEGKWQRWPTVSWALPWAVSPRGRAYLKIDRRRAHGFAVEMGVTSPAPWLRRLMDEWRKGWEIRNLN